MEGQQLQMLTSLFIIMTMMKSEKETKEQSAERPVTETTDEGVVKPKGERNTKNLSKSENLLQQF
jgi:hypothetical protein